MAMARARTILAVLLGAMLFGGILAGSPARAGEDRDREQEIKSLLTRIEVLGHEAKTLKAEGRHDAAELLWKRAHELREQARNLKQRGEEAHRDRVGITPDQAKAALRGLEKGMEALRILERPKELAALEELAHRIARRLEGAERARDPAGHDREIAAARKQADLMRAAMKAFHEAERRELASQMERALHALELAIEGRRELAGEARKKAPKPGQMAELLGYASKLWAEWGHESRAEALADLSRQYAKRHRAPGKAEKVRKAKSKKDKKAIPTEELMERMEILQIQLHELRAHVEGLTDRLRHLLAERERER